MVSNGDRSNARRRLGCARGGYLAYGVWQSRKVAWFQSLAGRYKLLAERGRFELPVPVKVRPLSRRVRSTTLPPLRITDRKSTRLNPSHLVISYAVFLF